MSAGPAPPPRSPAEEFEGYLDTTNRDPEVQARDQRIETVNSLDPVGRGVLQTFCGILAAVVVLGFLAGKALGWW